MRPLVLALLLAAIAPATDPVLLFPARLRLTVTVDGQSPEVAWTAFLNKLFDHFDCDADGSLSSAEARRVFPLPLPDGLEAKPDFTAMDTDKNGRVSREEFRAFYRTAGFTPVVVAVRPATVEILNLGDALFQHIDRDSDGNKPVTKKAFDDDPTALALVGLFDAADRDGDEKLSRTELEAFFDLVELGIGCRVVVTATDRGHNLFDVFDVNNDGRLDLGELNRASRMKPLTRTTVPVSYWLTVGRGPIGETFGPVLFGAAAKPKPPTPAPVARGPRWFRAADRNGDGFVSPAEFLGSPELFQKIDTDRDGCISPEEAEKAGS